MVKNKGRGGCSKRSSAREAKKAASQIATDRDLTPPANPAHGAVPAAPPEPQAPGQGHLGCPDRVFLLASAIFQNNHLERPAARRLVNYGKGTGVPLPVRDKDEEVERSAYELAFNTLKYQELLEDIMIDSCFHLTQSIPDERMSLAAVMLYDFQDRKFLPRERQEEEEIAREVRDVENHLLGFKTKLAASLARCRIKHNLSSIECILPESVRMKQQRSGSLPLYAWVNTLRSSLDVVLSVLQASGLSQAKSMGQLEGPAFCRDAHCADVLVFPARLRARLCSTGLLGDHRLIIQDKSCSLGPNAACSLLPEEGDVLMAGCFSGLTVCHAASLIVGRHKANGDHRPAVYVCVGDRTRAQREDLRKAVSTVGCKNVTLIPEVLQSLDGADGRLEKVRVILLTPKCSASAIGNPVEFLLREGRDTELLQDLCRGSIAPSKLEALAAQQREDIAQALKFPKVLAVVYSTCSSYPEENQEAVNKALQQAGAHPKQEGETKHPTFRLSPSPFGSPDDAEVPKETNPFFTLEPTEQSNGCFLAVLTREAQPEVKEAPQEVLARANAKGLLDRIGSTQPSRKEHRSPNASRGTRAAHARTSQRHAPVSVQPKHQQATGSNSTPLCGQQRVTDRRQTPQGKPKSLGSKAPKNAVSVPFASSKQESSGSSSSRPENSTATERIAPVFDNTTAAAATAHPAAFPCTPVVRARRAHQAVLRPVVLVLPPVRFPSFFPPQNGRTGFGPSFNRNKRSTPGQPVPLSRSSGGLSQGQLG